MRTLLVPIVLGSLSVLPAGSQSSNIGVIYGTVLAQDGTPAKGLTLNAEPLGGGPMAMVLPWIKTNEAGAYRFEHLPLGRYTVFAEDKEAGYSSFSTGTGSPGPTPEVTLTDRHPEAQFDIRLPPPAGFLLFHLTNRANGASISGVEVTIAYAENPSKPIFGSGAGSTKPMLVPSNRDLLMHVTSWGFQEWDQSAGAGKPIRITPGNHIELDVELQPANPFTRRIPEADPNKYQRIHDAKDWRNPYLIVHANGIELRGGGSSSGPVSVDALIALLQGLPDSAWPYGRVIAIQDAGPVASSSDDPGIVETRNLLTSRLGELGLTWDFWPSA